MSDPAQQVENYIATWNESDPQQRQALISALWSEQASYTDPSADVAGYDAINALIGQVQEIFAGMRFRQVGQIDSHHNYLRFAWELGPEQAEAPIAGSDVVELDQDGRFVRVIGFLDRVPAPSEGVAE